jgi:hypothetical protein
MTEGDLSEMIIGLNIPAKDEYDSVWSDTLSALGEQEVASWVEGVLEQEFHIAHDHYRVQAICEADEQGALYVSEVYIALWGAAIWKDPHAIEAYVSERLSAPCTVSVG